MANAGIFNATGAANHMASHFLGKSAGKCTTYVHNAIRNSGPNGPKVWSGGRDGYGWEMADLLEKTGNWRVIYSASNVHANDVIAWCNKNAQVGDCAAMTHKTTAWSKTEAGAGHGAMCWARTETYARFGADYDHGTKSGPCAWMGGNPIYTGFKILRYNGQIQLGDNIVDGSKGGCFIGGSGAAGSFDGTNNYTGGTQPKMLYNVSRDKQQDNILMEHAVFCKQQLMYEILESAGIMFYKEDMKTSQEALHNMFNKSESKYLNSFITPNYVDTIVYRNYCDNSGTNLTISEGIVAGNICNPFPPQGGTLAGDGYTSFSDNFVASQIKGGNANGKTKKEICIALYNYLIGKGVKWYVAVGVLCNAHSRMSPFYSAIDTHKSRWTNSDIGCWGIGFFGDLVTGEGSKGDKMLIQAGLERQIEDMNTTIKTLRTTGALKNVSIPHDLWSPDHPTYPQYMCKVPFNIQAAKIFEEINTGGIKSKLNEMYAAGYADCCAATLAVNKHTNPGAGKNFINYGQIHTRWASAGKDICNWLGFKYSCFDNEIVVQETHGTKTYPAGSIINPSTITSPNLKGSYSGSATWQTGGTGGPTVNYSGDAGKILMKLYGRECPKFDDRIRHLGIKASCPAPSWVEAHIKPFYFNVNGNTLTFRVHEQIGNSLIAALNEIHQKYPKFPFNPKKCGGFNYRNVNSDTYANAKDVPLSNHSYGTAVDINWDVNSFHDKRTGKLEDGYIRSGSPIVTIMRNHGWGWGGSYEDYMHFSILGGH